MLFGKLPEHGVGDGGWSRAEWGGWGEEGVEASCQQKLGIGMVLQHYCQKMMELCLSNSELFSI